MSEPLSDETLGAIETLWRSCPDWPPSMTTGIPDIDQPIELAKTVPMLLMEIKRLRVPKARKGGALLPLVAYCVIQAVFFLSLYIMADGPGAERTCCIVGLGLLGAALLSKTID